MCIHYSKTSVTDIWEILSPGGFLLWRVNEDKPPPSSTAPQEPRAVPEQQPRQSHPLGSHGGTHLTASTTDETVPQGRGLLSGRRHPEAPPSLGVHQVTPVQEDPAAAPRACLSPSRPAAHFRARPPSPHPSTPRRTLSLLPRALHPTCKLGPGGLIHEQGGWDRPLPGAPHASLGQAHPQASPRLRGRPRPFRLAPLDFRLLLCVWSAVGVGSQSSPSQGLSLITRHTQPPRPHKAVLSDFEGKLHNPCEAPHG